MTCGRAELLSIHLLCVQVAETSPCVLRNPCMPFGVCWSGAQTPSFLCGRFCCLSGPQPLSLIYALMRFRHGCGAADYSLLPWKAVQQSIASARYVHLHTHTPC